MLVICDYKNLPMQYITAKDNSVVLNLSSLIEGFQKVRLAPSVQPQLNDEKNFDIAYAEYIFSSDEPFVELIKIMYPLYEGRDVYLLVSRGEDTYDIVTESLCKLIQQRYGYNYQILNSIDDLNIYDDSGFSVSGIQMMDADKERYVSILQKRGLIVDDGEG